MNETVTTVKQIVFNKLIVITNIPNLPKLITRWTVEQLNHFDKLLDYAYKNKMNKIDWNELKSEVEK